MKILKEKVLHRTLAVIGFGQSKKASTYSSFLSKLAIETFQEFAGMKGWKIYVGFQSGKMIYLHYVLQK